MTEKQLKIDYFRGVDFASLDIDANVSRGTRGSKNFWRTDNGEFKKRPGFAEIYGGTLDSNTDPNKKINGIFPFQNGGQKCALIFTNSRAYKAAKTNGKWGITNVTLASPISNDDCYTLYSGGTISAAAAKNVFAPDVVPGSAIGNLGSALSNLADRKLTATYGNGMIYVCGGAVETTESTSTGGFYCYEIASNTLYELDVNPDFGIKYLGDTPRDEDLWQAFGSVVAAYRSGLIKIPTTSQKIALDGSFEPLDAVNALTRIRINNFLISDAGTYKFDAPAARGFVKLIEDAVTSDITVELEMDGDNVNATGITVTLGSGVTINEPFELSYLFYATGAGAYFKPGAFLTTTQFGTSGRSDRMSGAYKNRVWFSEEDDFTYWPDNYWADIGAGVSRVNGFLRLGDSTLAIFKEAGVNEPSIYYMSGKNDYTYDDDTGTIKKITPVFSVVPGASTVKLKNGFCVENFDGDTVFVADGGVYGIEMTENIQTNERVAKPRSLLLGGSFETAGEWSCIVYHNRLYVANGSGGVYVADGLQKWRENESAPMQYEWYYWEGINARCFAELDGALAFGTSDGRICVFNDDTTDFTSYYPKSGEISLDANDDTKVVYTDGIEENIRNGENVTLIGDVSGVWVKKRKWLPEAERMVGGVLTDCPVIAYEDARIYGQISSISSSGNIDFRRNGGVKVGDLLATPKGNLLRIHTVTKDYSSYSGSFTVDHFEEIEGTYRFWVATLEQLENLSDRPTITYKIRNKRTTPTDFEIADNYGALDFVAGTTNLYSKLKIDNHAMIRAHWYTPTFNLGADDYRKTLTRLTVSTGDNVSGVLHFGWNTDRTTGKNMPVLAPFKFADIDFARFSLRGNGYSSYTIRAHDRGFIYIRFFFSSEDEGTCHINGITANYRITNENRGLK